MPTAIAVASPGLALPPLDGLTPEAVVVADPARQSLDAALEQIGAVLNAHGHLVVLYPASADGRPPPAVIRRLHTVRAVLETGRMALLPLALPPLAVGVLARQLRRLSVADFSPGVLACAARLLAHYVHAGAQLGSVTRLDRVPVSLTSHVSSWLPGAQFGVVAHPTPQLVKVGGQDTPVAPGYTTGLTVAHGHGHGGEWVTGELARAWRVSAVHEVALPTESARWWATGKLTEFAAAIVDPTVLYQLVASVRREECHWCGVELIGDRCAFCSAPIADQPPAPRALAAR